MHFILNIKKHEELRPNNSRISEQLHWQFHITMLTEAPSYEVRYKRRQNSAIADYWRIGAGEGSATLLLNCKYHFKRPVSIQFCKRCALAAGDHLPILWNEKNSMILTTILKTNGSFSGTNVAL
ncbi:hypothetical protein UNPF46_30905 [Bradyrhizobium sp. UNPF46]|nr:hypothetical protein UNPF46_30905 [Bradyrhizobium sp. UNPF46]